MILYPQSLFRYSQKSVLVPRESISVLRESVSVSTKVHFGPFRYPESPFRYSESPFRYPRKSVSVRSGPFRSISVNRDTGPLGALHFRQKKLGFFMLNF